jgi:hypothetical protein
MQAKNVVADAIGGTSVIAHEMPCVEQARGKMLTDEKGGVYIPNERTSPFSFDARRRCWTTVGDRFGGRSWRTAVGRFRTSVSQIKPRLPHLKTGTASCVPSDCSQRYACRAKNSVRRRRITYRSFTAGGARL